MSDRRQPVWDLPTRLFHWLVVALVATAWISAENQAFRLHQWCGYAMLVLVGWRIAWGVIGSTHSRFAGFLRGPRAVLGYLRGNTTHAEGHNPAGGWSVVAMLTLLGIQAGTGLFNEDDIAFSGPLNHTVGSKLAGRLGEWHEINFTLLLVLVALHIGAVLFYRFRRGQDLVGPMIRGGTAQTPVRTAPWWLALLIAAVMAGALYALLAAFPKPMPFL